MTELKWICISLSLTLLLSLAVNSLKIDQKWFVGNHFGYEGGFCIPGLCIRGAGGGRAHYGTDNYYGNSRGIQYQGGNNMDRRGFRETLYCKPLSCYGGSCEALHLHIDKGLYESLVTENNAAKNPSTVDFDMPETFKYNVNTNYNFKEMKKEAAMAPQSN